MNPIVQTLLTAILDIGLGIGVPLVLFWLSSRVHSRTMAMVLQNAAGRAAGIGYQYLLSVGTGVPPAVARTRAVEAGARYLEATIPDTLRELAGNRSPETHEIVDGELGKLLASDPTTKLPSPPGGPHAV